MPDAPTPLDLDAIVAAIAACRTYSFGMYQADRLAHEHAPALVEEVKRLRADVAMTARPDLAWDEGSARCCTGDASQRDGHHKSCRYVHGDLRPDPDDRETLADAVLDLLPGRSEAVVKAEEVREVAKAYRKYEDEAYLFLAGSWLRVPWSAVARDLDDRAASLAAEGGADRG